MEKVVRNGKVAVLISNGYGSGWYTCNYNEELLFSPKVIAMIEQNRQSEINEDWIKENLGIEDAYCEGVNNLKIVWLPIGTSFRVIEYDGAERLITMNDLPFIA